MWIDTWKLALKVFLIPVVPGGAIAGTILVLAPDQSSLALFLFLVLLFFGLLAAGTIVVGKWRANHASKSR